MQLHAITVTNGYLPLAGTGANTIRKFSPKYQNLQVGDNVVMHYVDTPDTKAASNATEILKVSAVAIAPLDTLLKAHAKRNHSGKTLAKLKESILAFYPAEEGQVRNPDELYIVFYF